MALLAADLFAPDLFAPDLFIGVEVAPAKEGIPGRRYFFGPARDRVVEPTVETPTPIPVQPPVEIPIEADAALIYEPSILDRAQTYIEGLESPYQPQIPVEPPPPPPTEAELFYADAVVNRQEMDVINEAVEAILPEPRVWSPESYQQWADSWSLPSPIISRREG